MSRGSKVIAWTDRNTDRQTCRHTDRQTHRQTDRHDQKHYLPAYVGGKNIGKTSLWSYCTCRVGTCRNI